MTMEHEREAPSRAQKAATVDDVVQRISDREPRVRKARARAELASRILKGFTAIGMAVSVGLLIYLTAGANAAADAIADCTTPGGDCYTRSQEQTGKAVAQIVEAQQRTALTGSAPSRENLALTKANAQNIQVILGILDRQYPEAAAAVRAALKEGK